MNTRIRKPSDATALTNELISARQKYERTKASVIDRVVERRGAIGETITDLQREDNELAAVEQEARQ